MELFNEIYSCYYHTVRHIPDRIVVSYNEDRIPVPFIDPLNKLKDFLGGVIIQRAGGLVAE